MSLVKKPKMTEKKLAANRRNQKLCHGPVTAAGRERIRAAHLRHGFYAKAEEVALHSLGEEPARFQELLEGLWEEFSPAGSLQEGLVIRLARAVWLMNRADRMQEGYALRQARDANTGRDNRLHAQMMRLKMTADSLRLLVQSVAHEQYVTTPADLEVMKNLHQEGAMKEMGEIALALFYQLQAPGTDQDGVDPEEKTRRVMAKIRSIFGLSTSGPEFEAIFTPPSSEPQEGQQDAGSGETEEDEPVQLSPEEAARDRARQLLENILTRQVEICEAERKAILKDSLTGPSPYERAAEIAPTHPNAQLLRRMQDSNFREVRRVTNLLLKIKHQERQMEALEGVE
jgi:hypothetical protein